MVQVQRLGENCISARRTNADFGLDMLKTHFSG